VRISESNGRYIVDEQTLKQTINEIYEDIKNNYDKLDKIRLKKVNNDLEIKDETSGDVLEYDSFPTAKGTAKVTFDLTCKSLYIGNYTSYLYCSTLDSCLLLTPVSSFKFLIHVSPKLLSI